MTVYDVAKFIRWLCCWHDWRSELGRMLPAGLIGEKCAKCAGRRVRYLKLLG